MERGRVIQTHPHLFAARRRIKFFDLRLEQTREHGPLWLRLTGRDGVKQFIREEFGL
jgi:hypothetical protein